jgi:hypothetical protein
MRHLLSFTRNRHRTADMRLHAIAGRGALFAAALAVTTTSGARAGAQSTYDIGRNGSWEWSSSATRIGRLQVRLVRAVVSVRRTVAPEISIRIIATGQGARPNLTVVFEEQNLTIVDRYPAASTLSNRRECYPPAEERGAFWNSNVRLTVEISAPANIEVKVEPTHGTTLRSAEHERQARRRHM